MEDKILRMFFDIGRWEHAIDKGVDKDIRKEVLENMIRQLTKDSFLEQENEKTNTYKVMSAWHYLERLIESINIYDETEDEKPE